MRICDLTTLYLDGGQGGVNTYLEEKARFLADRPEVREHHIIVPGRVSARRPLYGSALHKIKSPPLPGNPQHRVLARFSAVRRLLRRIRPDVLEVDGAYFLAETARALPETAVVGVYHVHLPAMVETSWLGGFGRLTTGLVQRMTWRYVAYCLRRLDRLVVTSADAGDKLVAAGYTNLEHVPLGVNLELFDPGLRRRSPIGTRELLYVGRIAPEKALDVLIDAYRRLRADGRQLSLRIVGEGPCLPALRRLAAGMEGVQFDGPARYDSSLAERYANADVFVTPGAHETFNLTILEALASGLPVVTADGGGARELIIDGVGQLAAPGDVASFAAAIARVLDQPPGPDAARAHAASLYGWSNTFERLLTVYREAIAERSGQVGSSPRPHISSTGF